MPLVILATVLVGLGALTWWSGRRVRRRILGGSAAEAIVSGSAADPGRAANELRASIDAMNGRGTL
jgi:hypothetical protein